MGHLEACLELAAREKVGDVVVHAFLDGRDTPPRERQGLPGQDPGGDGRARRGPLRCRQRALLRHGPRHALGPRQARLRRPGLRRKASSPPTRRRPSTPPTRAARTTSSCGPTIVAPELDSRVADGDVCLFFNFRPDRARELTRAFAEPGFAELRPRPAPAGRRLRDHDAVQEGVRAAGARSRRASRHVLADVLAAHGLRQLHIAETEKYAHVTFFFNGGVEKEVPGEERILVPSPRDVPTYDHKPEMSARGVTDELVGAHRDGRLRLHRRELRQRRHGRPHRRDPGGGQRRWRPSTSASGGSSRPCSPRRRLPRHRRPRQLRPHARAGRQPQHRAQHQPRAVRRDGAGSARPRRRPAVRPRADGRWPCWASSSRAEMTGRDLLEPAT